MLLGPFGDDSKCMQYIMMRQAFGDEAAQSRVDHTCRPLEAGAGTCTRPGAVEADQVDIRVVGAFSA